MLGNTDMRAQGEEIRNIVRRVLLRTLGMSEISEPQTPLSPSATKRPLITEEDVEALPSGGELHFPAEAIVTPRARELALERRSLSAQNQSQFVLQVAMSPLPWRQNRGGLGC